MVGVNHLARGLIVDDHAGVVVGTGPMCLLNRLVEQSDSGVPDSPAEVLEGQAELALAPEGVGVARSRLEVVSAVDHRVGTVMAKGDGLAALHDHDVTARHGHLTHIELLGPELGNAGVARALRKQWNSSHGSPSRANRRH